LANHLFGEFCSIYRDFAAVECLCTVQVAHFYDTIDQQMITSQQPMMLNSALAFERIIKDPKAGL